MTATIEWG